MPITGLSMARQLQASRAKNTHRVTIFDAIGSIIGTSAFDVAAAMSDRSPGIGRTYRYQLLAGNVSESSSMCLFDVLIGVETNACCSANTRMFR